MKLKGIEIYKDDDIISIVSDSGEYDGFIEEDGTISFSVVYDKDEEGFEEFDEYNWKYILGSNHTFVQIINEIGGEVEAIDDYVMITVEVNKLLNKE